MTEYEKLLDRMYFTIGSTLMNNDCSRKGVEGIDPLPESEILRVNRRTYMELKVMMIRLERALYGEKNYEKTKTEVPNRDTRSSESSENRQTPTCSPRVGNFSC